MCRMLIALGKFSVEPLLESLSCAAQDQASTHELNEAKGRGTYVHKDGWGIAYLKGTHWTVEKSLLPLFADERKKEFYGLKTKAVLIHARKRSKGELTEENTHPFFAKHRKEGEIIFAHNGTISGKIPCSKPEKVKGSTDSERLFEAIMEQFSSEHPEIIRETIARCKDWDGTNVILATAKKTFISVNFRRYPHYFGMVLGKKPGFACVSSERLPLLKNVTWEKIKNSEILVIDHKTLQVERHN